MIARQATVTSPAPRRRRGPAPTGAPLRVVRPGRRAASARRRARLSLTVAAAVAVTALFGVVAAHAALTQGQFRLERLQSRAAEQQANYDRLRLQVAELESPQRVVAAARDRLGMVTPPNITYLAPTPSTPGRATDTEPESDGEPATAWSTVKPHLAGH